MRLFLNIEWPIRREVEVAYNIADNEMAYFQDSAFTRTDEENDRLYIEGIFGVDNRVRDFQRYKIPQNADGRLPRHCDIPPDCGRHVVVLLESPHRDEYGGKGTAMNQPIAPAMGKTGQRMDEYLGALFRAIGAPVCEVVISNPIQFQASLYVVHKNKIGSSRKRHLTNTVWEALWNVKQIRSDFLRRIRSYRPCLVVNACTRCLSGTIDKFLRHALPSDRCWKTTHPFSWLNSNNRRISQMENGFSRTF